MMRTLRWVAILMALGLLASSVEAHYNMLFPPTGAIKKGETVSVAYQWGHPFEHQLFDAPPPQDVFALDPDGKKIDLSKSLQKTAVPGEDKKKVTAYRFALTPELRGDYALVLNTSPIWMEEEKEFWQDSVKVIVHVQAQKGWDRPTGQPLDMVPLTRPYGLLPGTLFQAQVLAEGKPLGGTVVEIEPYNATPPKELPPDELITRRCKTDPNGVVSCILPDAGWWCLTAERPAGKRAHAGKDYPQRQRITFWVFVSPKEMTGK